MQTTDIFERLRDGETITPNDPEAYKMIAASFATKKLLVQMNNSSDPNEVRNLLSIKPDNRYRNRRKRCCFHTFVHPLRKAYENREKRIY